MPEKNIVILLGPSGSGKDHVAKTQFPRHRVMKLNQAFKTIMEQEHNLAPGTCNNKNLRGNKLLSGPCKGMTIQDAMVKCYVESLSPNIKSYGAQFAGITLLSALWDLVYCEGPWVITDLRKPSEAIVLSEFATKQMGFNINTYYIKSNHGSVLDSDASLHEVMIILNKYGSVDQLTNNW